MVEYLVEQSTNDIASKVTKGDCHANHFQLYRVAQFHCFGRLLLWNELLVEKELHNYLGTSILASLKGFYCSIEQKVRLACRNEIDPDVWDERSIKLVSDNISMSSSGISSSISFSHTFTQWQAQNGRLARAGFESQYWNSWLSINQRKTLP